MMPFTQDVSVFYATIYGGIAIGILFDAYRALKGNFKIINYLSLIFDAVFWFFVTLMVFITINAIENFDLRYYHFAALFIGFILYYKTISKFVLLGLDKTIHFSTQTSKKTVLCMVSILDNLYYVIIYSLHLLFDIIFYIPSIFFTSKKKLRKKYASIIKTKKRV
ncbi:spore cortex biosynthesis protein YabQ [Asaccharospora irregularis]|uniref:Spore cortex biosynthesis protein YabQ n=1 Tax=Asaccharospora irregularis DSM 2635 TaxID=1121321 RepID=A0A1M5S4S2_9FIRM|nr:spore cortex biosynthesis protein YabQ [Asaccharospora irregularis]SHH33484.1 spore cortex biosynthesis protein YabQ [Asaccharospora irregularis DSM 2635]